MLRRQDGEELRLLLAQDVRKVIITTIHKFGDVQGVLNPRKNIIVLVDEAHRTQEEATLAGRCARPCPVRFCSA